MGNICTSDKACVVTPPPKEEVSVAECDKAPPVSKESCFCSTSSDIAYQTIDTIPQTTSVEEEPILQEVEVTKTPEIPMINISAIRKEDYDEEVCQTPRSETTYRLSMYETLRSKTDSSGRSEPEHTSKQSTPVMIYAPNSEASYIVLPGALLNNEKIPTECTATELIDYYNKASSGKKSESYNEECAPHLCDNIGGPVWICNVDLAHPYVKINVNTGEMLMVRPSSWNYARIYITVCRNLIGQECFAIREESGELNNLDYGKFDLLQLLTYSTKSVNPSQ